MRVRQALYSGEEQDGTESQVVITYLSQSDTLSVQWMQVCDEPIPGPRYTGATPLVRVCKDAYSLMPCSPLSLVGDVPAVWFLIHAAKPVGLRFEGISAFPRRPYPHTSETVWEYWVRLGKVPGWEWVWRVDTEVFTRIGLVPIPPGMVPVTEM